MKKTLEIKIMALLAKFSYMRYVAASIVILIISSLNISYSSYLSKAMISKQEFFRPVIIKLISSGADSGFIYRLLENPEIKFDEKFVKINVSGFLNKADYTKFYDVNSIRSNRNFISENIELLSQAEAKYKVSKEAIASILWIETRHGKFLGKSNIVSVFFSTAMASEAQFIQMNKKALRENEEVEESQLPELDKKIVQRAEKKSNWAIKEILALEKMSKKSPISIETINGSWAGAFGMSQFLPSSYMSWAVDGNNDGKIDLFNIQDAVFSVANYLKSNGWNDTDSAKYAAVFHYNNSKDYVDAVLKLADKSRYQRINKPLEQQLHDLDYHGE